MVITVLSFPCLAEKRVVHYATLFYAKLLFISFLPLSVYDFCKNANMPTKKGDLILDAFKQLPYFLLLILISYPSFNSRIKSFPMLI